MSKSGKVLLIAGSLFLIALYLFRWVYGGWHASMWVPLVLGLVLLVGGLIKDRASILGFLTLRTTKHGLNMGAVILLSVAALVCVNVLAVRYQKKFDWTSDKLNTLSDQSIKAARGLKRDTELVLLYRAEEQDGETIHKAVSDLAAMYRNESTRLSFRSVNALRDPAAAQKFAYTSGPYAFFAVQGERKLKIDQPTEEGVTRALLKFGRETKKIIYTTLGHGERDIDGRDGDGLSFFKDQLGVTYEVKTLTLYQNGGAVPSDAAAVLVIRPQQQFLETEMQALRTYVKSGGRLLLAIDPGMKHSLAQLSKSFGIEFGNDFVLDLRSEVIQAGPATVLGSNFPAPSEITKAFAEGSFALFHVASSLKAAPDASENLEISPLIGSDAQTMATHELGEVAFKPNGPHVLAMQSRARGAAPEDKRGAVIVFGDSDFLSNAFVQRNLNNDLALNAVASLTDDTDLISIRPKKAKGTTLEMTSQGFLIYVLGFLLPFPLLMFAVGGFMWWRRRRA